MSSSIKPYDTLADLHQAIAAAFCERVHACLSSREVFTVALSGGSTPRTLYEMLSQRDLPWDRIHWFWGDERNVLPESDDSNYRMVRRALLDHVAVPLANIHAVNVNIADPAQAARAYESSLRDFFTGQPFPMWDLALLGMGDDAHTASLFPHTPAIDETDRWFVENWVEKFAAYRYTLTAPAINSGREIWFLVAGQAKRTALTQVLSTERQPNLYPAQLIKPTRWFVTADAWVN
jgi:6-phosphogluconolactonase